MNTNIRKAALAALLLLLLLIVCGCPPPAVPTPPGGDGGEPDVLEVDAADAEPCGDVYDCACKNLRRLDCSDYVEGQCAVTMERIIMERLTPFSPECVAAAPSREAVRKCPGIKCL